MEDRVMQTARAHHRSDGSASVTEFSMLLQKKGSFSWHHPSRCGCFRLELFGLLSVDMIIDEAITTLNTQSIE